MTIAVVILNWNGRALLERYLPGVVANSPQANIYVADNASNDDSVQYLRETFPTVSIIQNQTNAGYAGGYNQALSQLQEELFVLLNSDVAVTENWLAPIIKAFQDRPELVAAQPKILDDKRPERFEYAGAAGGFIDMLGYPYCRGRLFDSLEEDHGQYDANADIFWASGACLIVRRQAFESVGGLDTDLFAHQEEIDLCWRLQNGGGRVACIGAAKVYHLGGATLAQADPKKTYLNFRNSLLVLYKNVGGFKYYPLLFIRLCLDGLAGIRFLLQGKPGHTWAVLHGHFGFYRRIPRFYPKRKKWATGRNYFKIKSVVWQYFFLKRRNFNQLDK